MELDPEQKRLFTRAGLGVVAALLAIIGTCAVMKLRTPPTRVYVSIYPEGHGVDIGYVDDRGAEPKPLCPTPGRRARFAIDATGTRIAYVDQSNTEGALHVMSRDCSGDRVIAKAVTIDAVTWSPSGGKIAYVAYIPRLPVAGARRRGTSGDTDVFVVSADDGTEAVSVSNDPSDDWGVAWNPDGASLLFVSMRESDGDVYSVAADGNDLTRITTEQGVVGSLSVRADGTIAFGGAKPPSSISTVKNGAITRVVDATFPAVAAEVHGLTLVDPVFSPDGTHIAFSGKYVSSGIGTTVYRDRAFVMKSDGTNVRAIVHGQSRCPTFSPDSKFVATSTTGEGPHPDIVFFARVDDGAPDPLVYAPSCPVWVKR